MTDKEFRDIAVNRLAEIVTALAGVIIPLREVSEKIERYDDDLSQWIRGASSLLDLIAEALFKVQGYADGDDIT